MKDKILIPLVVVLTGAVAYLYWQNYQTKKKLDELSQKEAVTITPVAPSPGAANPPGASPFDKPNVDPLAEQFPSESANPPIATSLKFDRVFHDFGRINEGEVVKTVFKFTNTGKNPLVISNAQGSCGCTVPQWPRHAVKAGASDEIGVEFNSAGKRGENDKTVTVTANTKPATTTLTIRSTVIPKYK